MRSPQWRIFPTRFRTTLRRSGRDLSFSRNVPAVARVPGAVVSGSSVRIPADDPAGTAAQLLPRLGPDTSALLAIEIIHPSLESVFLAVTGRRYDPAVVPAA